MKRFIPAALTLGMIALGWLTWLAAGNIAEHLGYEDIDPLPRLFAIFLVLSLAERIHARFSAGHG